MWEHRSCMSVFCFKFVLALFILDPDLCDEECSTEEELCIANIFHSMDLLSNI